METGRALEAAILAGAREEKLFSERSLLNRVAFSRTYEWRKDGPSSDWLVGVDRRGNSLATPIDPAISIDAAKIWRFLQKRFTVGPFSKNTAYLWLKRLNTNVKASFDRDQSDYIYSAEMFRNLSGGGKKFRQYQHVLRRDYNLRCRRAGIEDLELCECVLRGWASDRGTGDLEECLEILPLALRGWGAVLLIEVDQIAAAFVIYEMIEENIAVALFLKYRSDIKGLSDYALRSLCCAEPEARILNTCQDLGILGLRKKKQALRPIHVLDKYYLVPQ